MSVLEIPEPDALIGAPHPRLTQELFGQSTAEQDFLTAFNGNRLHHAWLLTGPRGVGKSTLAWKIARFLLNQPKRADAGMFSGVVPATALSADFNTPISRRLAALSEPRFLLCRRPWDAKAERLKKDITVDEVRKINGFFNLSSSDGGSRVVLVDAADEMNVSAANALLKQLEEPPKDTLILLISHRPMRLLPTIRSRCRVLKCLPLGATDLNAALSQAGYANDANAEYLAALAGGSVGEAIRLLSEDGLPLYSALLRLVSHAPHLDRQAAIGLAETVSGKTGAARYDLLLGMLDVLLHRLAISGIKGAPVPHACEGEAQILTALSPDDRAAQRWAELAQSLMSRTQHARAVNLDPASVILDMFLKIDQTRGALLNR